MQKRTIVTLALIATLLLAGFFFVRYRQANTAVTVEILREAQVTRDRITATVNATGSIQPEALVNLTFGASGTVQEVHVVRGQTVQAGELLATLGAAELTLAVQQAEDALRIQQLNLAQQVNAAPSPATLASADADIASAEANLTVAQANLASAQANVLQAQAQKASLVAGATAGQIAAAEANLANAQQAQQSAVEAHDRTLECFTPPGGGDPQCPGLGAPEEATRAGMESANAALRVAQIQLQDLRNPATSSQIQSANAAIAMAEASVLAAQGNVAAAEANIARAHASHDRLLEPPTEAQIAILEAQVASAATSLEIAQLRLSQATIVAPIDGKVANVNIHQGEIASPGVPAITVVNEEAYHIEINVDEIDIAQIGVNQEVDITLDALSDVKIKGTVADIAPTATSTSGVVTYIVTINIIDAGDIALRPNMSASASIIVEEIDDVLIVPNWAVRLNRETGEAYVNRLDAGQTIPVEVVVETGLRNDQSSQIISGLNDGDTVVVTNQREGLSLFGGGGN